MELEEATKTSLIMPLFQLLGYDIFNPNEFTPEYIADVGIKKGEKVDYAIILENEVSILIEAKAVNEKLEKHDSQLFRYFGTSKAKFAILTNGIIYKFFTDLEKTNVMDNAPFLEINLEKIKESEIQELKKFQKSTFNEDEIFSTANDLKYLGLIKNVLKIEFSNPSDEMIKFILNNGIYEGPKTINIIEKYKPLVKKAINSYLNEIVTDRLQNAIQNSSEEEETEEIKSESQEIITTVEELQSYYIVKSILSEFCDIKRITYKDTYSYFGILYDNKVTKWICRVYLKENVKYIIIMDEEKNEVRYNIKTIEDIYKLKKQLKQRLNELIGNVEKEKVNN